MEYIVSIGAGNSQVQLIHSIKKSGYGVIACDQNPKAEGFRYANIIINQSTYDAEAIYKELRLLKKEEIVGILVASTGVPVVTAAILAERLGLPFLDIKNAQIMTDKHLFISMLNQLNIASPKLMDANNLDLNLIEFPVFVKPSKTVYSHANMRKCHNKEALLAAIEDAKKISENGHVNIEEFLNGIDLVSIDYVFNGKVIHVAVIGELNIGEPTFEGLGWYGPVIEAPADIAKKTSGHMLSTLNVGHGFFQTAMKYNPITQVAKIYETHAEIGGDRVNDTLLPTIFDSYSIYLEMIRLATGAQPNIPNRDSSNICIIFKEILNKYNNINTAETINSFDKHDEQLIIREFKQYSDMIQYVKNYE